MAREGRLLLVVGLEGRSPALDAALERLGQRHAILVLSAAEFLRTIQRVCERVCEDRDRLGLLVATSGIDPAIAANKIRGVRAARCVSRADVEEARKGLRVNVLCLTESAPGAASVDALVEVFLESPPEVR